MTVFITDNMKICDPKVTKAKFRLESVMQYKKSVKVGLF